jgi:hypothetical protein
MPGWHLSIAAAVRLDRRARRAAAMGAAGAGLGAQRRHCAAGASQPAEGVPWIA